MVIREQYVRSNIMPSMRLRFMKYTLIVMVSAVLIAAGIWFLPDVYYQFQEGRLIQRYSTDKEKMLFIDFIRKDQDTLRNANDKTSQLPAIMDMGLQWYNLQEYAYAVRWWRRGLDIAPNNVIGWYNLGNAYRELKKYRNAEAAYQESMRRAQPGDIDACLALGEMYRYNVKGKEGQEPSVYLSCLGKHRDDRNLIARLAIYYRDIGDRQNAILYFDRLWKIDPTQDVSDELRKLQQ